MSVEVRELVRRDYAGTAEYFEVRAVSERLLEELRRPSVATAIAAANQPGRSSSDVQSCFLEVASRLGFESERKGLFVSYESGLRPDYYLALSGTGIILEVERGKTTANNMDILDFWKVHLCTSANYLFLFVPKALKHNDTMRPLNQYVIVVA